MDPLNSPLELGALTEEDYARVQELYPELIREQVEEAAYNLDRYIEVVWDIYRDLRRNPEKYAQFKELIREDKRK